jgi:hypothetical protein
MWGLSTQAIVMWITVPKKFYESRGAADVLLGEKRSVGGVAAAHAYRARIVLAAE